MRLRAGGGCGGSRSTAESHWGRGRAGGAGRGGMGDWELAADLTPCHAMSPGWGPICPPWARSWEALGGCSGGCRAPAAASWGSPALHNAAPGPRKAASRGLCPRVSLCPGLGCSRVCPCEVWGSPARPRASSLHWHKELPLLGRTQLRFDARKQAARLLAGWPGVSPAPRDLQPSQGRLCCPEVAHGRASCRCFKGAKGSPTTESRCHLLPGCWCVPGPWWERLQLV